MSGVKERFRDMSRVQWVKSAMDARREVDRIATSAKIVPKSWRLTHGVALCDEARKLSHNVRNAYKAYPNTASGVRKRKMLLKRAMDNIDNIYDDLQALKDEGLPINLNALVGVCDALDEAYEHLDKRYKNTKLMGNAPIEERIRKKEIEILELKSLQGGM